MEAYAVKADRFFLPGRVSGAGYLTVENGRCGRFTRQRPDCRVVDHTGRWVAPGLVDTHIHGFLGYDVLDADPEGVGRVARGLTAHGVTSWLPTVLTASVGQMGDACASVAAADDVGGAHVRGIFLEGPFFTERHKGAQNPRYFQDPSVDVFKGWQERARGLVRKIAIAPERAGSVAFTEALAAQGVHVALAHSDASYEQAMAAVDAGADVFVHTYNGMSPLHHREPGMVGAAMTSRGTYAEVICDGLHVSPTAAEALVRAKGTDHTVLVTDCLRCGGMPDGDYYLGEFPIVVRDGVAHLRDGGNLAGSTLTLDQAVRNVVDWNVATAEQALRMASEVPARSSGLADVCGSLRPGLDADFVVLDRDLTVEETYVSGSRVYQRGE